MPYADEVWDQMLFGLRLGKNPRVFLSTTPRSTPLLKSILKRDDTKISRGRTSDNVANLSERAVRDLFERYEGTWLGAQELDGELIDEAPGALWTIALIEGSRVPRDRLPEMLKVVVAIDPAVSDGPKSDSTGIAVVGLGVDRNVYVLADLSMKATPDKWGRVAIEAYHEYGADLILYEKNQGGNLIAQVLKQIDPFATLRPLTAVSDKAKRALPVVGLFEQGRAHIVGVMPKLEEEMTGWQPGISKHSPDRMDAMVHGAAFLAPRPPGRMITPSQGVRGPRGPRGAPGSARYPGSFPPRGGSRTWVAR
jgi:phage terminase large subunit-like protein